MPNDANDFIIKHDDVILVTGAAGFIGAKVVENLLDRGFTKVRCFVRKSIKASKLARMRGQDGAAAVQMFEGNLLSLADCVEATREAAVVIHLAAGRGEKSFPDAFMNSVVTTRNLLEACVRQQSLRRLSADAEFITEGIAMIRILCVIAALLFATCLNTLHRDTISVTVKLCHLSLST